MRMSPIIEKTMRRQKDTLVVRMRCFYKFVVERETIREKKEEQRRPAPWTNDPILRQYHFCNICRADDRVTKFIGQWATKIPRRHRWFAFVVARWINEPATLDALLPALKNGWQPQIALKILREMARNEQQIFRGSYIINSAYAQGMPKYKAVVLKMLTPIWRDPPAIVPHSIESNWSALMQYTGMGSFMAGQVVADWQTFGVINGTDVNSWAPLGPGSKKGLKWIYQNEMRKASNPQRDAVLKMRELRAYLVKRNIAFNRLTLHDVQNCLCEFSKYVRGYSRIKYVPFEE